MLPSNVAYGRVVGRVLIAAPDGPTPDRNPYGFPPPPGSNIIFTPAVDHLTNVQAEPPVTVKLPDVTGFFDPSGNLVDARGAPGVILVATDNPTLSPINWTYRVTVNIAGFPAREFNISLPADSEVDITDVTPIDARMGIPIIQGPPGPRGLPGAGLRFRGIVASSVSLPATGNEPSDAFVASNDQTLWVWDGDGWRNVGPTGFAVPLFSLTGSLVNAGGLPVVAENGDTYITEDDSHIHVFIGGQWLDLGAAGIPGPPGPPAVTHGPTAPLDVRYMWVDTSSATPVAKYHNGASWEPLLVGEQGPEGPQGPQGPPGQPGPFPPGASAGDILVADDPPTGPAWIPNTFVSSSTLLHIERVTQAEYNALSPPDPDTLYVVM